MEAVLLDTNIISFLLRGDSRAELYLPDMENRMLFLSFMTVAELFQWSALHNWGEKRREWLEESLSRYTILSFGIELCKLWAEVRTHRVSIGRPISSQDAWIAATALQYQIPLITHNPMDFNEIPELSVITHAWPAKE